MSDDNKPTPTAAPGVDLDAVVEQPPPVPNDRPAVWDLVIADMRERDTVGRQRYGTPLQPHNGRASLVDAYQEALDLAVYLRQRIAEDDDHRAELRAARDEFAALRAKVAEAKRRGLEAAHLAVSLADDAREYGATPDAAQAIAASLEAL